MSAASRRSTVIIAGLCLTNFSVSAIAAAPPIRTTKINPVPACVTTARLNAFLSENNRKRGHRLAPRFRDISKWYRHHGEKYRVRWDYAFFQMVLETNFLSFRKGKGGRGDVAPSQNNFAGLGTTGHGVPGDSFKDVSTGVLAQIQHIVVYSGERIANPVAPRTRRTQNIILEKSRKLARKRPITFKDLAKRWAADPRYHRSIERIARMFYSQYCRSNSAQTAASAPPMPATTANVPAPRPRPPAKSPASRPASKQPLRSANTRTGQPCKVQLASFGGTRSVLIRSETDGAVHLTVLGVLPGFEKSMSANFIRSYAPAGKAIATYDSKASAIAEAHRLCRIPAAPK